MSTPDEDYTRCCEPFWFCEFYRPLSCVACDADLTEESHRTNSLMIRCFKKKGVHMITIPFCSNDDTDDDCEMKFWSKFNDNNWGNFCTLIPISVNSFELLSEKSQKILASQAFDLYDNNNITCNNCSIWQPKAKKFQLCSQCRKIRYCSKECQKQDWKDHKLDCKLYAGIATPEEVAEAKKKNKFVSNNKNPKTEKKPEYCDCYDNNDLLYYNAAIAKKCVNPDCERLYSSRQVIDVFGHYTSCTKKKGFHVIPFWFCSSTCERKTAGQYKMMLNE